MHATLAANIYGSLNARTVTCALPTRSHRILTTTCDDPKQLNQGQVHTARECCGEG